MAVTTTTRLAGPFLGNGLVTVFPFAFKVFQASDLELIVVDASGNAGSLSLGVDYTATLNANQDTTPGGVVTLTVALPVNMRMVITSGIPQLQEVILTNLGGFFPDVLNGAFDRLTILNQQQQVGIDNSIKVSPTDGVSTELPPAAQRAGKVLSFGPNGEIGVTSKPSDGAQGPQGSPGPAGALVADGTNGPFKVRGNLQLAPTTPTFLPPQNSPDVDALNSAASIYGHGRSLGNIGLWSVSHGSSNNLNNNVRGIKQGGVINVKNAAIGDNATLYLYNETSCPGIGAPADEGATSITSHIFEPPDYYHATILATTGAGDTTPSYGNVSGYPYATDGGIMVNTSRAVKTGTFTARSSNQQDWLLKIPVTPASGSLPLCTAWGKFTDNLNPSGMATSQYVSTTVNVTVNQIGGNTPAFTLGIARLLGSNFPEIVLITNVGTVNGGVQSVTFQRRYPQASGGGYLFQGGLAGTTMSLDANYAFSRRRTCHPVGGSIDGSTVIFGFYVQGFARGSLTLPVDGEEAASPTAGSNGITFYPSAEITVNLAPMELGISLPVLEYNNIAWQIGDNVEACFSGIWGGTALWVDEYSRTPGNPDFSHENVAVTFSGENKAGSFRAVRIVNNNPETMYRVRGGPLIKPLGITFEGGDVNPCSIGIRWDHPPDPADIDANAALLAIRFNSNINRNNWCFFKTPSGGDIYYGRDTWFDAGGSSDAMIVNGTVRCVNLSIAQRATVPDVDFTSSSAFVANMKSVLLAIGNKGAIAQTVTLTSGENLNFDAAGRFISKT